MRTNDHFHMELPKDWKDRTVYLFMGPNEDGVQHTLSVIIDREYDGDELADYAEERIELTLDTLDNARVVKEGSRVLPSGMEVYECVYKWVAGDDLIKFNKLAFMIIDDIAYMFSATFTRNTIETIGVDIDRMIESFTPGLPEGAG